MQTQQQDLQNIGIQQRLFVGQKPDKRVDDLRFKGFKESPDPLMSQMLVFKEILADLQIKQDKGKMFLKK